MGGGREKALNSGQGSGICKDNGALQVRGASGSNLGLVDNPYELIEIGKNSVSICIGVVVDGKTPISGARHSRRSVDCLGLCDIVGRKLCGEQILAYVF